MSRPRRLRFEGLEALVMLSGAPGGLPAIGSDPQVPALYASLWPQASAEPIAMSLSSVDDTPPTVISFSPQQNGLAVFTGAVVTFKFSEPVDPATLTTATVRLLDGTTPVAGSVTYHAASRTATLTPSAPLANSTTYTIVARGGASGIKDLAGNALAADVTSSFTTVAAPSSTYSLFNTSPPPENVDSGDGLPIELGMMFSSSEAGYVTSVRFYKSAANTGTHTGSLWNLAGQRLAQVTFTGETASGWQQADFDTPVPIAAGQRYVVSYHTTTGHYAMTPSYFESSITSGPLFGWADGLRPNGRYAYGGGGYPDESFQASNYWVDVVVEVDPQPDTSPPQVTGIGPDSAGTPVDTDIEISFSERLDPSTVTADNVVLLGPGDVVVPTLLNYYEDHGTQRVRLAPDAFLDTSTTYTVLIRGGASGIKDAAGNPLPADVTSTFTTEAPGETTYTLFDDNWTPNQIDSGENSPIELGLKFQSNTDGYLTGIRYYKSALNTGPHVGRLWSSTGQLLAMATFSNETASGWQHVDFVEPVAISAGATYTVSYHTTTGHYSAAPGLLVAPVTAGPLTALASGGVYRYGSGGFPSQSHQATYYWVAPVFTITPPPDTAPPTVSLITPASGATGVATDSTVDVTFSEAMDASTINSSTIRLLDGATPVAAGVSYNAATRVATLTPSAPLANSKTYTVSVTGGSGGASDLAGNPLASNLTSWFTTASDTYSLFNSSATPAVIDGGDAQAVEVGVKFQTSTSGYLTGIRFYKATTNTGVHTAHLWSSTGQLLASATFTGETASGWQEVSFATPVAITVGQTYTASYHTAVGRYSLTRNYFNGPVTAGPLTALAGGGVYRYGAAAMPTQSFQGTNYWIDPIFSLTAPPDTTAPTIENFSPGNTTNVDTGVTLGVTFSEAMDAATINSTTVRLLDGGTPVAVSVSYNASTKSAVITPSAPLAHSTAYTISVTGGASGVKDLAGNALASTSTSSFTTVSSAGSSFSLFNSSGTPAVIEAADYQPIELGVKFQSSSDGYLRGIRFYKGSGNTGVHTGNLWSSSGQLLATATFTGETASGWQELSFTTPVPIANGQTYTVSYHTTSGRYSFTRNFFDSPLSSGPLTALAGGGVYRYGASGLPTQSFQGSNYWVDPVFSYTPPPDTTAPTVLSITPGMSANYVAPNATITVTFSEALDAATVTSSTIQLFNGATPVTAGVSYDAATKTATLTPTAPLANSTTYSISVTGGAGGVEDAAGNALAATVVSSFTTADASYSLFNQSGLPAVVDGTDAQPVEVGVKFQSSVNGYITGLRFYKGAGNTGVHTAHLWSSTGQLLATATFTSETATGWQEVSFASPVAITAGQTYTASYHSTSGRYSYTRNYFGTSLTNGPLTALAGGGVYAYGSGSFPTQSYQGTNYWVDPIFRTTP